MKKPLKSVHITNYYHPTSGGVRTNYNRLLAAADKHQRYVRLIVPGAQERIEEIGEYGRIYFVRAKPAPMFDKRYRIMYPWDSYLFADTPIRKILIDEQPDMIEIYDNYALSLLAGIIRKGHFKEIERPMLVYFTGERMDNLIASFVSKGKLAKWFAKRLMGNYNFPMFDYHIANSPYVAEELYEAVRQTDNPRRSNHFFNFCWRYFKAARIPPEESISICPRGVNTTLFSPGKSCADFKKEIRRKAQIPNESIVLFFAGRLSPDKNIGLLVKMMEILGKNTKRDYRLLIAGSGPYAEKLMHDSAEHAPGRVVQIGQLDPEQLAQYYANSDVFVHPNPREPFGNVVLEAMASGVPALVPNSGGVLSFANYENAWVTQPTADKYANAVREIVANDQLREQKIYKALETARDNTQEKAVSNLFDTYDQLYADFTTRRELFIDLEQAQKFDFAAAV